MLGSETVMAFVATTDAAKARGFYEKLGLRFVSEDKFALQFDANGIVLRIQKMAEFTPARFTVLGWEVADIERAVDALTPKRRAIPEVRAAGPGREGDLDRAGHRDAVRQRARRVVPGPGTGTC